MKVGALVNVEESAYLGAVRFLSQFSLGVSARLGARGIPGWSTGFEIARETREVTEELLIEWHREYFGYLRAAAQDAPDEICLN